MGILYHIMRLLDTLLNIVFPTYCVSCRRSGFELCDTCVIKSPLNERQTLPWIFALFDYRHPPIKKALWLFKYKSRKRLAKTFAESLYGNMLEELSDLARMENFHNALLIPVPLSKSRYRERGYNQVELLGRELARLDNGKNFALENKALIKIKETARQAHTENRAARIKNIQGSFAISKDNESIIKDKNIILIDDITTTGATLNEAKKTLKRHGARKVIAFTIAH